jgi:acetyl-CoA C-acetyltransferase
MPLDGRLPVIVGVGQTLRRPAPEDVAAAPEPVDMMAEAAQRAEADAGASLLARLDSVRTVDVLSWRYADPAALLAERLGVSPRDTLRSTTGGNSPQMLVNDTASAIQRGELDVALIAGAEAMYTRFLARKTGDWLAWTKQPKETPPGRVLGIDRPGSNDAELSIGLGAPTQVYPIIENALRLTARRSVDDHLRRISELWARCSVVAAGNPHAWSPQARTAEEIRTVTPDNRMIGFPYPKLMNANIQTDQAAALLLCSVDAARAAGVPADRWVFVHSGADAHDHWFVSERDTLTASPAAAANGRTALGLAGIGVDDVAHVDLYSCFPSAVQIGAAALGLDLDRRLTTTGGLTFAGGPGNNYSTHGVASLVSNLRADPGAFGLATALGWYLTKHSIGVYSTEPPAAGFRWASPQAEVDALPRRELGDWEGDVELEGYTVMHERDGSPSVAFLAGLRPDGRRAWRRADPTEVPST